MFRHLALAIAAAGVLAVSAPADAQDAGGGSAAVTQSPTRASRLFNPFAYRASKRSFGFLNLFRRVEARPGVFDESPETAAPQAAETPEAAEPVAAVAGASGGSSSVSQAASGRPSYRPPVRSPYRPPPRPPF
ncbi:MAG: hypothetical protein KDA37_09680 [Planctomycetales bacterium]|nr:hypothetical protein [Planctomycetales bacterium]